MTDPERRRGPQRNAGAFLGPDLLVPVPMRTLSDDLAEAPPEPDPEQEPAPARQSYVRRLIDRLRGLRRPGR